MTRLPPLSVLPDDFSHFSVMGQVFRDEQTIQFARPWENEQYTVRTDGSGLRAAPQIPEAVPARPAPPLYGVALPLGRIFNFAVPGTPRNSIPSYYHDQPVVEVFRIEGENSLQLTSFGRYDTRSLSSMGWNGSGFVSKGGVLLMASPNRSGDNPSENCQLFSIDSWGGKLRQLTDFDEGSLAANGCNFGQFPDGCAFADVYQDPVTQRKVRAAVSASVTWAVPPTAHRTTLRRCD